MLTIPNSLAGEVVRQGVGVAMQLGMDESRSEPPGDLLGDLGTIAVG
jgi:hypothetical protein